MKMDTTVGLMLLTILCASVGGAAGSCRHVKNDDMVEYTCNGGSVHDLQALPRGTGKIRISNMPIPRITADTFSRFGSELWVLSCSVCGITDIEPGALSSLDNLQQLSLDDNGLTEIKASWFKGLDYLTYLDLSYNDIRTIEDGVFENLPSLVDLRLSGNRLECLDLEDMSHLKELKRIFISENREFKCPNAVSSFLEDRGVSFEKDPEWSRIPNDLVSAELPREVETPDWRTTPLPAYRERLHPSTTLRPDPRTSLAPSSAYPTEEVFYPSQYVTPDWRTTPEQRPETTYRESPTVHATTPRTSYSTRQPYVPPRTISPLEETVDYPPYAPSIGPEGTTLRSRPSVSESGNVPSESPPRPAQENENKHYEQPRYPSEATRPPFLAAVPTDHRETPSFVEPDVERTEDPYRSYWTPDNVPLYPDTRYPDENVPPEYFDPSTEVPRDGGTHVVRPLPPSQPESYPSSPDGFFQAPYYEPTVTVRPPPLENYQEPQEEGTASVVAIETTTDKPLPDCPSRNSSSMIERSLRMIVFAALLIVVENLVLVEGF